MKRIKTFFRIIYRFVVLWLVDVFSLWMTSLLIPGITLRGEDGAPALVVAVAAALMLGIVNLIIRPLILLLALPFGFFALFAVGLFVNAIAMTITAELLPGFSITSPIAAFVGGLLLSLINTIITSVLTIDDDDQFYQGLVERIAARQPFRYESDSGHGLVMLEIDGLSYWHMQKAIADGWMPTVAQMVAEESYQLSHVDCGLPSQTSACQAGILFGDNYDIPAFRWYDKREQRLIVSGRDAAMINDRFANGKGLLRGGSSINNMLTGDAEKSLLTLANLREGTPEEQRRRAQDMYLLLLNPYFLMRTIVLFVGDMLLEIGQYLRARLKNTQPRLNRLAHFYPLLRASTTVFLRDVAAYLLVLDIIRGSPSIYVTWPGYDEVAHHSGPWSKDAFDVLRKFDKVIARVRDIIVRKAPITYELLILSDHGQSFGPTFLQRYGITLEDYIEQLVPMGTRVILSSGGDDGTLSVRAMRGEIENIQQQGVGGRVGQTLVRQTDRVLEKSTARQEVQEIQDTGGVIVCGSGNLAQVYFDLLPRRLTIRELELAYPGMLQSLVNHEGVGFVVAYEDLDTPVVLGTDGRRNLKTDAVEGIDPLLPYGDVRLRASQIRRLAAFPNAGDLIVNSSLYPDGTVAAMEELIGNHGGLGGEQTDAFLLHPADLEVPPISNATEIYRILDARREQPAPRLPETPLPKLPPPVDTWQPRNLWEGLQRFETWLTLSAHALWLNRDAIRAAVEDPFMTAPSLLVVLVSSIIIAAVGPPEAFWSELLVRLALWPLLVLVMFATGRLLGGSGSYVQTLRGMGFAQVGNLFQLLELIQPLAPIAQLPAFALTFIGTWIGIDEAHDLSGWRVWVIPLVALLVLIGGIAVTGVLISGAAYTIETLVTDVFGMPGN